MLTSEHRLVNPYVQPVLYVRRPGSDHEESHRFPDDDPFFSEVSVLIDNIEDIEEDPETSTILSSFEGTSTCVGDVSSVSQLIRAPQMPAGPTSSLGPSGRRRSATASPSRSEKEIHEVRVCGRSKQNM